jgi:hypothetical protein
MADAITWTDNWRKSDHILKAESFIFKADDFRDILKESSIEYIRLYIGLKIEDEDGKNKITEKMICVGADDKQKDVIDPIVKTSKAKTPDDGDTGIYDFSHPCPPLCLDLDSPLAGGKP